MRTPGTKTPQTASTAAKQTGLRLSKTWGTLFFLGACYGGGEPAGPGPLLSWTDDAKQGDEDEEREDEEQDDEEEGQEGEENAADDSEDPDSSEDADDSCLSAQVAALRTKLNTCRTCHIRNGVAEDTAFVLTKDASKDAANLQAAFAELGQDLFRMPAQENGAKHPGGTRLNKGTKDYDAWLEMMKTLDDPESCSQ